MKHICFVAQFPPPTHGLSQAVDTLYSNNSIKSSFQLSKVNITNNRQFIHNLVRVMNAKADIYYLTISQSKMGNIRDLMFIAAFMLKRRPFVIHLHGGYYRTLYNKILPQWQKNLNRYLLGHASQAIVLGNSLRDQFSQLISPDRIKIVPNCVDQEYVLSEHDFQEKLDRIEHESVHHVLYLSNFILEKGYRQVLELANEERLQRVHTKHARLHFDFAGQFFDASEQSYFENYVRNHDLKEIVTLHGVVSGDEKRRLLERAAFFVLLTNYPKEGQPISIIEAMGNGAEIITTKHAGIPDLVVNNVNGKLFEVSVEPKQVYSTLLHVNLDWMKQNYSDAINYYNESVYVNRMAAIFNETEKV